MANLVQTTVLLDGPRNLVLLVNLASDNASGELTNVLLVDRSNFVPTDGLELAVEKVSGSMSGFTATLSFDATADLAFCLLPNGDWFDHNWTEFGGISSNKSGAGANGDILISTAGFTATGDVATFLLAMRKQ